MHIFARIYYIIGKIATEVSADTYFTKTDFYRIIRYNMKHG